MLAFRDYSCPGKNKDAVDEGNGEHGKKRESKPIAATWRNDYGTELP
jgi:hypothetical protein